MLNARWVIAGFLIVLLSGVVAAIVRTGSVPSPERYAVDSFSGQKVGSLALYHLLDESGLDVSRQVAPPSLTLSGDKRVLLISPSTLDMKLERDYLRLMRRFVEQGGHLVIASDFSNAELAPLMGSDALDEILGQESLLEYLGLQDLRVTSRSAPGTDDPETDGLDPKPDHPEPLVIEDSDDENDEDGEDDDDDEDDEDNDDFDFSDLVKMELDSFRFPVEPIAVRGTGRLSNLVGRVNHLAVPADMKVFEGDGVMNASGMVQIKVSEEQWEPVVLTYTLGAGELTLVSEPAIFCNGGLGQEDNGVLAFHLAAGNMDLPVVIDEYYHRLLPRDGFYYLLGIPPYAIVAFFVFIATSLFAVRAGKQFGPARPVVVPSRRSILVYVDAMARLFERGGKTRYVLSVCRKGLVSDLTFELGLDPGTKERIVMDRLEQSDAVRHGVVRAVLEKVDATLARSGRVHNKTLYTLQEMMHSCRKTN